VEVEASGLEMELSVAGRDGRPFCTWRQSQSWPCR
jgi:hypothetical protein